MSAPAVPWPRTRNALETLRFVVATLTIVAMATLALQASSNNPGGVHRPEQTVGSLH